MAVWKGGRGVKAPYTTTHVRIPEPLKDRVQALSEAFKAGEMSEPMTPEEAVEAAQNILKKKKSAKVSMQSLLTAIYGKDIEL